MKSKKVKIINQRKDGRRRIYSFQGREVAIYSRPERNERVGGFTYRAEYLVPPMGETTVEVGSGDSNRPLKNNMTTKELAARVCFSRLGIFKI